MATDKELARIQQYLASWPVIGCTHADAALDIDNGVYDWLLGPRPKRNAPHSWWRKLLRLPPTVTGEP